MNQQNERMFVTAAGLGAIAPPTCQPSTCNGSHSTFARELCQEQNMSHLNIRGIGKAEGGWLSGVVAERKLDVFYFFGSPSTLRMRFA